MLAPYCYRCPVQHTFPQGEFACLKASFELRDAEGATPMAAVSRLLQANVSSIKPGDSAKLQAS